MITQLRGAAIATAMLALSAGAALAQGGPPWQWGWQWGWWFWLFPAVRIVFVLACIAAFAFLIVRAMRRPGQSYGGAGLDILNERFARGEIDRAEYEEKRRLLLRS